MNGKAVWRKHGRVVELLYHIVVTCSQSFDINNDQAEWQIVYSLIRGPRLSMINTMERKLIWFFTDCNISVQTHRGWRLDVNFYTTPTQFNIGSSFLYAVQKMFPKPPYLQQEKFGCWRRKLGLTGSYSTHLSWRYVCPIYILLSLCLQLHRP